MKTSFKCTGNYLFAKYCFIFIGYMVWKKFIVKVLPSCGDQAFNDTDEDAIVFPVQDAGLQTYLRTLFIEFYTPKT